MSVFPEAVCTAFFPFFCFYGANLSCKMAGAKGNQLKARLYSTRDDLARIDLNIVYNQNWQYSFKKYLE